MKKVGKSIAPFHQLRFAYGVQLGILDATHNNMTAVLEDEAHEAEAVDARYSEHNAITGAVAAVFSATASADRQVLIDESAGEELSWM